MDQEENNFEVVLESNRVEIVQRLQLDRTFLFDYLRSKSIFDCTDCELVLAEKTRDMKAGKFLDILISKGQEGFDHFIDALQLLNPGLYEQVTGEKASARPNPIMTEMRTNFIGDGRMPDLDIMSNQLQRTISDLNDITLRYQGVLKEKQSLVKKLDQAASDLEVKYKKVEELEKQKSETATEFIQAYAFANTAKESVVAQLQSLHRDLQERNTYIIALQMKLLASQEKIDNLKNQVNEVGKKQEDLENEINEITQDYNKQRRESIKLSERLAIHKSDFQRHEEIKMKLREVQFNNQKLKVENKDVVEELNNLKDWTEVLRARYDIVEDERKQIQESHEFKAAECCTLRYRIDELDVRLSIANRELEEYRRRNADLEQAVKTVKEQRDFFSENRTQTIIERDQARLERDYAVQRYNELMNSRDETITKQAEHIRHFEEKYDKTEVELRELQKKLSKTELELEEIRRTKLERGISYDGIPTEAVRVQAKPTTPVITSEYPMGEVSFDSSPSDSQGSEDSFNLDRRRTEDLVNSIKKRIGKGETRKEEPLIDVAYVRRNLDRKIELLVPQRCSLSAEAKQSVSLDRNRNLFKVPPTLSSLECMFEKSIFAVKGAVTDITSLEGSGCVWSLERDGAMPKSSTSSSDSGVFGGLQQSSASSIPIVQSSSFESETFEHENSVKSPVVPEKPVMLLFTKNVSSPDEGSQLVLDLTENQRDSDTSGETSDKKKNRHSLKIISSPLADQVTWSQSDDERDRIEVEQALLSPTLQGRPFRQRLQAVKLKESEKDESSSVPSQSHIDDTFL